MRNYYYLIASIPEVILQGEAKGMLLGDFLDFCSFELHPDDYKNLRMMYLFNDIKNAINYEKIEGSYLEPSFYTKEEFVENLKDFCSFLPFLSEYFFMKKNGKRAYPKKSELDEVYCLFYDYIDELECDEFVKRYYIECELVIKNIASAMMMRFKNNFDEEKIIPYGDYYEKIIKTNSLDLGLALEFPFIEKLVDALTKGDYVAFEETLENARWQILDDFVGTHYFGVWNVYAIGVKLASVERWKKLSIEKGKEKLESLLVSIKNSIVFPQEFTKIGGRVR